MEKNIKPESLDLRQNAEERLKNRFTKVDTKLSEAEVLSLIHELEVHQIELEMQNEELILAKVQATLASEKYIKLYDSAPSGYFTLSSKGEIIQLNQAGAAMLGKTQSQLKNRLFHIFVTDNSKPFFILFLEKIFSRHERETCELTLLSNNEVPINAYITGIVFENGGNCLITAIDITERKLLESNVVEKMILQRETEKAGKIGGWSFNVKTLIQNWTQETFNILEIDTTYGEPKVQEGIKFIDEPFRQSAEIAIKRAIEFGEPFEQEWKVTTAKGNKRWVNTVGKTKVAKGKTIGLFGSIQDITERKQTEEELQASEEKYHAIFDNAQDIFYQTDLDGTVLEVSPSVKHFSDFNRDEIIGKPVTNLYYDLNDRAELLDSLKKNGEISNYELRLKTRTGELRYVSNNARLVFDSDGKPNHINGEIKDITQRKLAEIELQASKDFLNSIINAVALPVFVKDVNHKYVLANNAYCLLIKIPLEKIIGSTDDEYFPEEQIKIFIEKDNEVLETGKENSNEEYLTDGTGKVRTVITKKTLYTDSSDNKFLVGVINDITERKLAEKQIERLNRVYTVLSNINKTIVRVRNKQLLFEEACSIAVENGGFKMAWIGMVNYATNKIDAVASLGLTGEYINNVNIDLNNKELSSGPAGQAFINGKCNFSNNIETDEKMTPWRKKAREYGFRSVISLPIIVLGKTIGTYTLYSGEIDFFNEDEIKLLEEIASDISFAIEFIESDKERKQAEVALKENNSRLELAMQSANMAWWEMDITTGNVIFEKRKSEMIGYPAKKFKHYTDFVALVHPEDSDKAMKAMQNHINGLVDKYEIEYRILTKSGEYKWFYDIGAVVKKDSNGIPLYVTGLVMDISQRKLAEEALRKSEAIQHKIVSNIGDVIVIIDQNGINRYKSPNVENLFGWKPEELVGKSAWNLVHPDDLNTAKKIVAEVALKPNASETTEIKYRRKDGVYVWIEITIVNLLSDPDIQGFLGNYNDISERKHAQEKIREKDLEFKKLSSNLPDLIFQFTRRPDGTYYVPIASEGIKNIFGCKPEDVINDFTPIGRVIHPDDIERVIADIEYSAKHVSYFNCEFRVLIPGKPIQWIYSKSTPEKLPDGSITWYGFNADISERKRVEDSLVKLKTAIEKSEISVVITDENGNIEYANPFFDKISGYSKEEYIGKNSRFLKSAYHSKEFYEEMWNTIKSGQTWEGELYNCNKNGEMYWENTIISPVTNSHNEITNFVAIKTDITQVKNMNSELILAKERAEESDRLKSAFLANMSHEIRTPMNGILGFTELLKEPDLSDDQRNSFMDIIEKSGERLLNIINDIIDISKIESGLMKIKYSEINVNEYLNQILAFFIPEADAKNIKLTCSPGLLKNEAYLKTDGEKLHAILTNLVKNALKYTETGFIEFGYIRQPNHSYLQFYVKDTGIGIPKDRKEAIFERFVQADIVDKMARQGAGLGLSISKSYVEMLRGSIWVESEVENLSAGKSGSSTFYFTLPYSSKPLELSNVGIENLIPANEIHINPEVSGLKILCRR